MGFDLKLFVSSVDEDLKCPVCRMALENPVSCPNQHLYCDPCIRAWLKRSRTCPLDRVYLNEGQLKPAPRIIVNILKNLEIKCPNHENGCRWTIQLDDIAHHLEWCPFQGHGPSTPPSVDESEAHPIPVNPQSSLNEVQQLRSICDKRDDLDMMKKMIQKLKSELENIIKHSEDMHQSVEQINGSIADATRYLQYAQSQVIRIILCSDEHDLIVKNAHMDNYAINCTIMNLNEFITEEILMEYLRQHGMRPIKCVLDSLFFARSRNFRVVIRLSDLEKLSNSNIWPIGVIIVVNSCNSTNGGSVISGNRARQECTLFIEAGGTYE
ncbi:uncharacterized protein LOC141851114 [Brevipalpus obovatus]|uniref:uncharacterized protein LOC141851114 n=1 Tax=Brevipalpus obovatus TaxID=246614 RepID=UPI003D9E97E9